MTDQPSPISDSMPGHDLAAVATAEQATTSDSSSVMTRLVEVFLRGDVAILLTIVSLILGAVSLWLTPREEEPQIVVPMADVLISAPGMSAEEVEQQVTSRVEKMLYQIDGVEYVYSMSRPGQSVVTVRFYVGEDREDSLIKLYNKLQSNVDQITPGVSGWVVKPIEVDDVPILVATLWTDRTDQYGDFELRRLAEQFQNELQAINQTNRVWVVGGRPRQIRVEVNPSAMAARQVSILQIAKALQVSNVNQQVGSFDQLEQSFVVDAGRFVQDTQELGRLVVGLSSDRPVHLHDVAVIRDGPAESTTYSWLGFGPAHENEVSRQPHDVFPAVQIAVAKQKGSNAVWVADAVKDRLEELSRQWLPDGVHYQITRDYGETADDKVNELVEGLAVAVLTVIVFIGVFLGWRAALVVALAIPVCYSLTLFINLMAGYTINRVTMFALILSLGLLVDDPITDVENIARYFALRVLPPRQSVLRAVQEVRPALLLSTLAIIASFLPMAFITGMMGPYMAPMALNVPLTVSMSTVVAFVLTPWLAMVALRRMMDDANPDDEFDITARPLYRIFRWLLTPMLEKRWISWAVLAGTAVLFAAACLLPALRMVPLKMLPYDNKNEFQIIVDMPEGTTLERTESVAREVALHVAAEAEVTNYCVTVGTSSPMDFNGMVRHYFLRSGSNVADIRFNLVSKDLRVQQSHELILRIRNDMKELSSRFHANLKLVEVPPGPPVLATITAEVYGRDDMAYAELIAASRLVAGRLEREPFIEDVDISAEDDQQKWVFEVDKPKAAMSGVSTQTVVSTLGAALNGLNATILHQSREIDPLNVQLRLPRQQRSALDDLRELYVPGDGGALVQLGAIGSFHQVIEDKTIYHKNLKRVVFVYGEVAGRAPADAIIDMQTDQRNSGVNLPPEADRKARDVESRTWLARGGGDEWQVPEGIEVEWAGEGEWQITLDVFRDLGLAFAAALIGIFMVLMFQTGSRVLPPVMMLSIPLTLIGIMPGFWFLNAVVNKPVDGYPNPVFFTATAMIGMIALAGIVVRNSVVLIDFIHLGMQEGHPLKEAIIRSVAIRTRPILLTAGTTLLGNWVITLDPIFSGLAWSVIFGIVTSTLFTLFVIPVVYWLIYGPRKQVRD
ncbi:MAG: efflux RND transporter permease subunit [Planctomycetaceae bacterium]